MCMNKIKFLKDNPDCTKNDFAVLLTSVYFHHNRKDNCVCDVLEFEIINNKMDITEKKYPVEKAKGVSTKYDKL